MNPEMLFEEVAKFIADSRALLEQGAVMELAGLDKRVSALCEEVLMLSPSDHKRYADKLQSIFNELTALGNELTAQRDKIGQEINDISQHKKAHVAYRIVDASDQQDEE